ncbi:MAG: D-alanyl-D-alanine carboxypeptidase family protein [Candidatus Sericytochromatia bacterium]
MSWLKVTAALALGAMSVLGTAGTASAAAGGPAAPGVTAAAAIVLDGDSGQVLWERNAHQRRAMASTTKIMTSLLAVESGRLDETVTISKRAASIGEATIFLKEGEKLSLRDLTYGVLLSSGNDASTAVAEFLGGGSEAKFIELMNKRAAELGLKNTHFTNPHGLPSADHYSTAYDLAVLLRVASAVPAWNQIAETKIKKIPLLGKADGRTLRSHNKLLWNYPHATGGKTGFTNAAGRCFIGSARKNGRFVIQSTLAASDLWGDSQKLLAWGLDNFESVVVAKKGEIVGTVPIKSGSNRMVEVVAPRDVTVVLPRGTAERANLQQVWQLPDQLNAPVDLNQPVGQLIVKHNEKVLATVPLVAAQAVPAAASTWEHISSWFFPGMLAASVLSLFRLQGGRRKARKVKRRVKRMPPRPVPPPMKRGGTGRLWKAS